MNEIEKENYIKKHLQHELRFLLSAVETWRLFKKLELGFSVNIARDSVCVHFRGLLKFFISSKDKNDKSVTEFGIPVAYKSEYSPWIGKIDEAILHISPKRAAPKDKPKGDLNDQMDFFKIEILRLWAQFTHDSSYSSVLNDALIQANKEVGDDIKRLREILEVK